MTIETSLSYGFTERPTALEAIGLQSQVSARQLLRAGGVVLGLPNGLRLSCGLRARLSGHSPMPTRAARALAAERVAHPAIGGALLFPSRRDPGVPVSRHLAADWLKRAYRYAGLSRPPGGLWHPFRRKWATERKHHPVRDLAEAGGWKDVQTLLTCYVQADLDTMREVVEQPQRRRASPGVSALLTRN